MNNHFLAAPVVHLCRTAASLWWVAGLILSLGATLVLAAESPRNVLVLYSENRVLPGLAIIDETLHKVIKSEYGAEVEVFTELLALDGPRPDGYDDDLFSFLRAKYSRTRIDAIVAVRGPAFKFILRKRDQLLPGVPVVHVGINTQELAGMELPGDVIGVPVKLEPEKTIQVALRLHPGARRVVVITGTSEIDRDWESLLRRAFRPLEERIAFEFWAAMPLAWAHVERSTMSIAGRAVASLIHSQGIGDTYRIYAQAQRDGVDFNLTFIPSTFNVPHKEEFDNEYMRKLYDVGYDIAVKGTRWVKAPPGLTAPRP